MEASAPPKKVAEQDIFGGAVSDSEEEDAQLNVLDVLDENSQNSAEDSHLTDSNSIMVRIELSFTSYLIISVLVRLNENE